MKWLVTGWRAVLLVVVILLAVLIVAGQVVLNRRIGARVRDELLPRAEREWGVPVRVERTSASLFGGSLALAGLRVGNPPGFGEADLLAVEHCQARLALSSLAGSTYRLHELLGQGGRLFISRDKAGDLNLAELGKPVEKKSPPSRRPAKRKPSSEKPAPGASGSAAGDEEEAYHVERLRLETQLRYRDPSLAETPMDLTFDLHLAGENIRTGREDAFPWANLVLTGHLHDRPDAWVTHVQGELAPWVESTNASFRVSGAIDDIDLAALEPWTREAGFAGTRASADFRIVCTDGVFDGDASRLNLVVMEPKLAGKAADQMGKLPLPRRMSIEIPITGTLEEAEMDIEAAVTTTVLKSFSQKAQPLLDAAGVTDDQVEKELNRAAEKLRKLF